MSFDKEKGPFIFISYSHKDAAEVRKDANKLIEMGARIWIDHRTEEIEDESNIQLSQNWFEEVEKAVCHPNCRAVIFYVSANFLLSKAIEREQRLIREKEAPYYCVSMNGDLMSDHLLQVTNERSNKKSPYYDKDYFGKNGAHSMHNDMFDDDKLMLQRVDSDECVREIYNQIVKKHGATDDAGTTMSVLQKTGLASRDTGDIPFGVYKEGKCDPVSHPPENCRFTFMGKQYIHYNGDCFTVSDLKWKLLYVQDARAVLLCSKIPEIGPFTEAQDYLQMFKKMAFSLEEAGGVGKVRLMNLQDVSKIDPSRRDAVLALDATQEHMYWWIDQEGAVPSWRLTYQNNKPVINGFLVTRPKGYRPVIEVRVDDLKNIKGG